MRNRVFKAMCKVPMNLQLFAEDGDGAGAGEGNGGGSGEGTGGEGDNPPSFDDFLKTGSNQAEFDRRVQKAVNTAVTNAQEKWQALTDDKLSEAEKLAKMETVKKAFQTAVEKAVDEKLKGGKPPKKAPETNTQEALEKQVYNAMMGIF